MRKLYFYDDIVNLEYRSSLKIKTSQGEKTEINYIKKKAFKKAETQDEEELGIKYKVIGYTKFKPFKDSEEELKESNDDFIFAKGCHYRVTTDKVFLNRIKGYVKISKMYGENGTEIVGEPDTNYYLAITKFSILPILPLLLLVLLLLLLKNCPRNNANIQEPTTSGFIESIVIEPTTAEAPKLPIDENADDWDNLLPTNPSSVPSQEDIEFIGYDEITVSKEFQVVELINPYNNSVYFRYSVYANDTLIYKTNLIPSGKAIKWNAYKSLIDKGFSASDGKINLIFCVDTYDVSTQQPCTPGKIKTKIIIK